MSYTCFHCNNSFQRKHVLERHVRAKHLERVKEFACDVCTKQFFTKDNLQKHIREIHTHTNSSFVCSYCGKKFQYRRGIVRHFQKCHMNLSNESNLNLFQNAKEFKCGFCDCKFPKKWYIKKHYEIVHHIDLEEEELQFASLDAFEAWKLNLQLQTMTQFICRNKWETLTHTSKLFRCDRSCPAYRSKSNDEIFQNTNGSKKLGTYCPAEMTIKVNKTDGACIVHFMKTHIGHKVGDRLELCYNDMEKLEKLEMAVQLEMGIPCIEIWKKELHRHVKFEGNRLSILNAQDIDNIVTHDSVPEDCPLSYHDDNINVDAFVARNKNSVLFYKGQGQEADQFHMLDKDDFLLVFMNDWQENQLKRYGHKVIAFDGTHGTNKYKFILHTLLVYDVDREGIPVAFLITNLNNQVAVNIFLTCIRDKVGYLNPKTLMSDMQNTYYSSWLVIMGTVPEFRLFCTWHIREAWRRNLNKISVVEKRSQMYKQLLELSHELNPVIFEAKLENLLSTQDEDVQNFLKYFRKTYSSNVQYWAYCYRKNAGINVNIALKSFHRNLKYGIAKGEKMTFLYKTLRLIEDFLKLHVLEDKMKCTRGKMSNKLVDLRECHHHAEKYMKTKEDAVVVIDSNTWLVPSFTVPTETYLVCKISDKEIKECMQYGENVICGLPCELCQTCFHEFTCTCLDSEIHSNMCKHIHAVGIFLRKSVTENTEEKVSMSPLVEEMHTFQDADIDQNEYFSETESGQKLEDLEYAKQQAVTELLHALEEADTVDDINEMILRYIKPISATLRSKKYCLRERNSLEEKISFKNQTTENNIYW